MSQIQVSGLTFGYDGSPENVFEEVTFSIDTNWKLGFIGRNGKGKTTFLNLLLGKYEYAGRIVTDTCFDYFPYQIEETDLQKNTIDLIEKIHPDYELWKICRELDSLQTDAELLYRPLCTLSHGERTKVMLAVLFSRDHYFLLIDEPTNHLDAPTREVVRDYLNQKKGFILVSHDRWLLDGCIDHVLVLERNRIEIEKGTFSSWWENKERRDQYERAENDRLKQEIGKLQAASRQAAGWADKVEGRKIGFDPTKEHDRPLRAYFGEKSRKMQKRRKNLERRKQAAIAEKEQLLKNVEETVPLRLEPLTHHKEVLIRAEELSLFYGEKQVLGKFRMELCRGDRIVIQGRNGCGKSSLIKAVLRDAGYDSAECKETDYTRNGVMQTAPLRTEGILRTSAGLVISYISQDTSHLRGSLRDYSSEHGLQESLFKAVLRQIGFERSQFERNLEEYSEGQKKKVLIASSLVTPAHLYIWDEPLNYIDVFARMQIEQLILQYSPTMLIVEHDHAFAEKCGTKVLRF